MVKLSPIGCRRAVTATIKDKKQPIKDPMDPIMKGIDKAKYVSLTKRLEISLVACFGEYSIVSSNLLSFKGACLGNNKFSHRRSLIFSHHRLD